MTSVLDLPVAEQYPSSTDTSTVGASKRTSHMSVTQRYGKKRPSPKARRNPRRLSRPGGGRRWGGLAQGPGVAPWLLASDRRCFPIDLECEVPPTHPCQRGSHEPNCCLVEGSPIRWVRRRHPSARQTTRDAAELAPTRTPQRRKWARGSGLHGCFHPSILRAPPSAGGRDVSVVTALSSSTSARRSIMSLSGAPESLHIRIAEWHSASLINSFCLGVSLLSIISKVLRFLEKGCSWTFHTSAPPSSR